LVARRSNTVGENAFTENWWLSDDRDGAEGGSMFNDEQRRLLGLAQQNWAGEV